MIALFHAVADCADLVDYWDIATRSDGVLLRARSRLQYSTEQAAADVARVIADRIRPHGYDVRDVSVLARTNGQGASSWHAFVEILVS